MVKRAAENPRQELGTDGLRGVLDKLVAAPFRDVGGRSVRGIVKTGEHSEVFWSEVQPLKDGIVERTRKQLAVDENDGIETLNGMIDGYAEARLLRQATFIRMVSQGGPITGKGKMRAIVQAWGLFFDREMRAAERLGLVRRARRAQTPIEWLRSLEHEQEEATHDEHAPDSEPETGQT